MGALRFTVGGVPFTGRLLVAFEDGRLENGRVRFDGVKKTVTARELEEVVRATHGAEGTRVRTRAGVAVLDIGRVVYDAAEGKITGFEDVRLLRWEPQASHSPRSSAV